MPQTETADDPLPLPSVLGSLDVQIPRADEIALSALLDNGSTLHFTSTPPNDPARGLGLPQTGLWCAEFLNALLVPPPPSEAQTAELDTLAERAPQYGDLWLLEQHRLLIGDCTKKAQVARLFGPYFADQVLTDPPYGCNLTDKNGLLNRTKRGYTVQRPIQGDTDEEIADYTAFYDSALRHVPLARHNTIYVFMGGRRSHNLMLGAERAGITAASSPWLIWRKNQAVISRGDYHQRHELIFYGWKGKHKFFGDRKQQSIIDWPKPQKSELHPSQKPIGLLEKLIENGCPENGVVYDGFVGSGSTILACENTGRMCIAAEKDPHYAQIAIEQWEKQTGKKAVRFG